VGIITMDSDAGRHVLRHSTAHVMAQAVTQLWPGARFAIGPPIEDGFYYDFDLPEGASFNEDDLERIDGRMREIIASGQSFVREEHSIAEGLALFADQPYKREIIEGVDSAEGASDGIITSYRNSESFVDLCRGPHVPSTDRIPAFKLMKVAGAYWRGDEKRPMLQRIYGTAWESDKALKVHLERLAEAEKRDHRKLGVELDLFSFDPMVGSGLPLYHPNGGLVRKIMEDYSRAEHERSGYAFVSTPHIAKSTLFETSGHLDFYADGMYPPMEMDGASYYPKPMNCPMHMLIYRSRQRSYRDLPLRLFELGTVYRYEKSGVVGGLLRARGFTQDDSHIFCTPEQLQDELASLLAFVIRLTRTFGFEDLEIELATRPEKFVGAPEDWDQAEAALAAAIDRAGLPYVVAEGEGAFYAPKIDVHIRDALGRRWQGPTVQVDLQLPERFDLACVGADNARQRPWVIHRAMFGSFERFFALLIEQTAGAFDAWMAPVQVRVLGVRNDHDAHAETIVERLRGHGFRADWERADEPLGARIRRAKMEKLPFVLVVGDDDVAAGTVGVNERGGERPERGVAVDAFIARLEAEARPPDQRA
ncbi:MAG TPA: threonine--tRNA ligase, partial [Acidimicrobiales bacterium]|nr:threonine--tRNA ligase [Acidimicrobiales bacterium]